MIDAQLLFCLHYRLYAYKSGVIRNFLARIHVSVNCEIEV